MINFFHTLFSGYTTTDYISMIMFLIIGLIAVEIFKRILMRISKISRKKIEKVNISIVLDDFVKYIIPLLYITIIYFAIRDINFSSALTAAINIVFLAACVIFITRFVIALFLYFFSTYWDKNSKNDNPAAARWINTVIKIIIWGIALLIFLENSGVEITGLIAGLGIGGIAIAFAAQTILEDLFNFFAIVYDEPFLEGDFISIDSLQGTVEHIGIKTTRLRSFYGEELIFSNTDLVNSRIKNYKSLEYRRIVFSIGVEYSTPSKTLKEIPGIIEKIVESVPDVTFERATFSNFGSYSLDFEVSYFVNNQDYIFYMDKQQEIFFKIKETFDEKKIEFAFPTQTILTPDQNSKN